MLTDTVIYTYIYINQLLSDIASEARVSLQWLLPEQKSLLVTGARESKTQEGSKGLNHTHKKRKDNSFQSLSILAIWSLRIIT